MKKKLSEKEALILATVVEGLLSIARLLCFANGKPNPYGLWKI